MMVYGCINDKEVVAMAYAIEYRRAVAKAHEECGSSAHVAEQFGCSESWVRKLVQIERETGSLEARKQEMPDLRKFLPDDDAQLRALIAATPDMTLGELAAALTKKVSVSTVWRATQRLKLPLKKSRSTPPSRIVPTSRKRAINGTGGSGG
jgi:transposase